MSLTKKEKVILVHGLFMHGIIMQYLEKKLLALGYDVVCFSYPSIRNSMAENTELLVQFMQQYCRTDETCHFVGHSLGGLLIRLAYERVPQFFTGRIVTLGTPHNGSLVADRVANDIHESILGGAYENALDGELPAWRGEVELGSIAGSQCIGIGMALKSLPKPNDGTVSVEETRLQAQKDHLSLPVSHTALVFSQRSVKAIDDFLQNGYFFQ